MALLQSVRGTKDILPNEIQEWYKVEQIARKISEKYGYKELRTPIFEKTEVFARGVGDGTDIVNKEMYTFNDKSSESITLRPEQTAAVVRSIIQNNLLNDNSVSRIFYIGSYFRYERPQKGRLREFHQFGAECINSEFPESDAEIITLAISFIKNLGINNYRLLLNSLGNEQSRINYKKLLMNFFAKHKENLSNESKERLENNPLRILDSKNPIDIEIIKNAPNILNSLDEESIIHFEKVKKFLETVGIKYEISPNLVRGLDYYSHTVFELQSSELGSQDAFGGGGRYNSLFSELGGKPTPAVGFAMGIERILLILEKVFGKLEAISNIDAIIIPTNEEYLEIATKIAETVRNELNISCICDLNRRSLKSQLREANKFAAKWAIIIGEEEIKNETVSIKFMKEEKNQVCVKICDLKNYLI